MDKGEGLPRNAGMTALAARHAEIAALMPRDQKIIFLDYPLGKNVGDLLIMLGTLYFFKTHGLSIRLSRNLRNTEPRGRLPIGEGDTIVLQGGGNFGDLYPHIQNYRERIIDEYPDHRILIFPQTIFYQNKELFARAAERINRHPDLTFFVRDTVSAEMARPYFGERVRLVPDMAHQLWPALREATLSPDNEGDRIPPLFFMRDDEEAGKSYPAVDVYRDAFVDWADVNANSLRIWKRLFEGLAVAENRFGFSLHSERLYFDIIRREVERVARRMGRHPVWVTSRLHGFIMGLLLGKPVFAVDNSYGKLSSYISTWQNEISPVVLIASDAEAISAMKFVNGARTTRKALWTSYSDAHQMVGG
ncbi:MAG: polysaccharide pyruvyl transferase family protein [Parvibaculum sp.]|nr:polysaccharide pyruvyl transferase family protein [Parvibaculum sp.]